jgi:hypothetical protein
MIQAQMVSPYQLPAAHEVLTNREFSGRSVTS